jgi:hypothetical protein
MDTTTLKSGRELGLALAPFATGSKLFKTILAELRTINVDVTKLEMNMELDLRKIDPRMINILKDAFCEIASSEAVEMSFFECASRCLLDSKKITRETFESPDMREDYLPVAWEVIKYNLAPFFRGLASQLSANVALAETAQK